MALGDLSDPEAVQRAVSEFDELGRDSFLEKYGFGRARQYFLIWEGRRYDSKAIVGAAHGYQFPDEGPLASVEFAGGELTVRAKLENLGFEVVRSSDGPPRHAEWLLDRLCSLKRAPLKGGSWAPHKPLLALLAIARVQSGEPRLCGLAKLEGPLGDLIERFTDGRSRSVEEPFWRLQADEIWEVVASDGSLEGYVDQSDPPPLSVLRGNGVVGGFRAEVFELLEADPELRDQAAAEMARIYFGDGAEEVLRAVGWMRRPVIWWVNQGRHYQEERDGGYLWATLLNKAGRPIRQHTNVGRLRPGDVVFHYSVQALKAVSTVTSTPEERPRPDGSNRSSEEDGYWCGVEYIEAESAIGVDDLHALGLGLPDPGPFNVEGGGKEGYLWDLDQRWALDLAAKVSERFGYSSPISGTCQAG